MGSVEVAEATEILEPGRHTLAEMARYAESEHALVIQAGESMVDHAIAAGQWLLRAREECQEGNWQEWVKTSLGISPKAAAMYMRLARHPDLVSDTESLRQAQRFLTEAQVPSGRKAPKLPLWLRDEAKRLRAEGATIKEISERLEVSYTSVQFWLNPDGRRATTRRYLERRRKAELALRAQERERQIALAVRKAGAATQEAWAMAERMQDVIAQAQREAENRESKRALSLAGEHYRKMRDEIVRALGVA